MYTPPQFEQPNIEAMQELMSQYPLASLITLNTNGIEANHIPLHHSVEEGELGCFTRAYSASKSCLEKFFFRC